MNFKKVLLYPFSVNSPYFEGYAWAVELALRMNARLQLLTSTASSDTTYSRDAVYHSLLEAHGYYLQHYQHSGIKFSTVVREPCITEGHLKEELISYLNKKSVDILILDSVFSSRHNRLDLQEIVEDSGGVIILSEERSARLENHQRANTDHFYNHLRSAELYKLPENFFATLGKDHSVFNYLRELFQKNHI